MSFPNVYTHRRVADSAAKGCEVCFKPSSSVLITAENKDKAFCTPVVDKAAEEARKKRDEEDRERRVKEEMERLKKEYEEKAKGKKKGEKGGKDETDEKTEKEKEKEKGEKKDEKKDKEAKETEDPKPEPRVFALQKFVYQQRLEKKRQVEIAKRNRERLAAPGFFPSVPKSAP